MAGGDFTGRVQLWEPTGKAGGDPKYGVCEMAFIENPDLEFCQHNDVLIVTFGDKGRLAHLNRFVEIGENGRVWGTTTPDGKSKRREGVHAFKPMVWAFIDNCTPPKRGESGRCDDHWWHARGLRVGSVEEGHDFLMRCRAAGISVRYNFMYVPFSNGQKMRFSAAEDMGDKGSYWTWKSPAKTEKETHRFETRDFLEVDVRMADVHLLTVDELVAELKNPATP